MASNNKRFMFYSEPFQFKSEGEDYFLEGYISTYDEDLVQDVVTKKGMKEMAEQLKDRNIKLDFQHEAFRGEDELTSEINKTIMPLGRFVDSTIDKKGIKVRAKLNPNWKKEDKDGNITRTFKEIWSSISGKFYDAFSIAFMPTGVDFREREGKSIRLLDGINLLNVALTGNPVNPNAKMTNVMAKSLEYMKDKEDDNMGKKDYGEDGKHIHNDQNEMGEHAHPYMEEMIDALRNRLYELEDGKVIGKGEDEEDGKSLKNLKQNTSKGDKMVDEIKNKKSDEGEEEGKETEKKGKVENKAIDEIKKELVEVKSKIEELKGKNKDLENTLKEARQKGKGPESKAKKTTDKTVDVKGPMDMIW